MKELKLVEYDPICPYCERELDQLCVHPRRRDTGPRRKEPLAGISAVSCPHCRKLLGASTLALHEWEKA